MTTHPIGFARTAFILWISATAVPASPASAETPQEQGRAIAEEMDRRDLGWNDSSTAMKMVLFNAQGQSSTR
jgi:hypothetical protein